METLLSKYDFNDDWTIFYKSLVKDMKNWFVFYSHKTTVERQASIIAFWLEQVLIHRQCLQSENDPRVNPTLAHQPDRGMIAPFVQ